MKNIEFLNICYKYFNRFITVDVLIEKLESMDNPEVNKLVQDIKKIYNENPNEEDDFVINEKNKVKTLIDKIGNVNEDFDLINKQIDNLKKDYEKKRDSYELWYKVVDLINENDYFNENFDSLTDYELLEFIAQNIKAPFPPKFSQEEFDRLVQAGIENDEREYLWRLAFNYENFNIDFSKIINYFIEKNDSYYIMELICAVGEKLDIDKIIDKLNNKEVINYLLENKDILCGYLTNQHLEILKSKI